MTIQLWDTRIEGEPVVGGVQRFDDIFGARCAGHREAVFCR